MIVQRPFLVSLLLACALAAPAQVKLLVADDGDAASQDMAYTVSELFEKDLDVRVVVWSKTDPIVRDALLNGLLEALPEKRTIALARRAGEQLGCTYVLWVVGRKVDQKLSTSLEVFRPNSGRAIFRNRSDATNVNANSGLSIAADWSQKLRVDVFKSMARVGQEDAPPVIPGTTVVENPPPLPQGVSTQFLPEAEKLIAEGRIAEAMSLLFRAVDQSPLDLDLRLALIELLRNQGLGMESNALIESTLVLFPGHVQLRLESVRALLDQGSLDLAQTALNEALVRTPEDPAVWQLNGEYALLRLQGARARAELLRVMAKAPGPRVQQLLALAVALEGDAPEAEHLLNQTPADSSSYRRFEQVSTAFAQAGAAELSEILRLKRLGTADLLRRAQLASAKHRAMASVAARFPTPAGTQEPAVRALAHNLLAQAAGQVVDFVKTGNHDTAGEAEISISDAMRRLNAIPSK